MPSRWKHIIMLEMLKCFLKKVCLKIDETPFYYYRQNREEKRSYLRELNV